MKSSVINPNSANETLIRELYRIAEEQDTQGFVDLFAEDGYFWDVSAGTKYYGQDIGKTVDVYATAFRICTGNCTICTFWKVRTQ